MDLKEGLLKRESENIVLNHRKSSTVRVIMVKIRKSMDAMKLSFKYGSLEIFNKEERS